MKNDKYKVEYGMKNKNYIIRYIWNIIFDT